MNFPHNKPWRYARVFRFALAGGSAAVVNLILAYIGVDLLGFRSELQQNLVNIVAMWLSLVYSFMVYRVYVWGDRTSSLSRILRRQLPLYHLSAGLGVLIRTLLFPVLLAFGVHYLPNIVVGIVAGATVNYLISDRYVFKDFAGEKGL